ncbi:MAG: hypothetical protein ACE5JI_02925 [Acidobacteriota bacterium]
MKKTARRAWWMAGAVTVLVSLVFEVAHRGSAHPELWWHEVPTFDLAYGFVGTVAIVLFSKWAGRAWFQKNEDYYEDRSS